MCYGWPIPVFLATLVWGLDIIIPILELLDPRPVSCHLSAAPERWVIFLYYWKMRVQSQNSRVMVFCLEGGDWGPGVEHQAEEFSRIKATEQQPN